MQKKHVLLVLAVLPAFYILTACGGSSPDTNPASGPAVGTGAAVSGEGIEPDAEAGTDGTTVLYDLSCRLTEQLASGLTSPVVEQMSPELAAQLTEEQLKNSWEGEAGGLTGYQGIETVFETVGSDYEQTVVSIRYKNNEGVKIKFEFNNEKQIKSLFFERITLPPLTSEEGLDSEVASVPVSYEYEETDFTVGRKPYELDGVLTMPQREGKVPVVILFSGGDADDMDGTVGSSQNTPMRDLAYGLANRGIATLRYNRRLYQYASEMPSGAGMYALFVQDACYAIDQVYNDRRIDREQIFLLGHGKAADYLPALIERKENRLAGAVFMAGKPVSVTEKQYTDDAQYVHADARYLMDKNSTLPVFVLQAEDDFETGMEEYKAWRGVWEGRAHTEYRSFKNLNHYFINSSGKKDASEYDTAGKVNAGVIEAVAAWVTRQLR